MTVVSLFKKDPSLDNTPNTTTDQLLDLTHQQDALQSIINHYFDINVSNLFLNDIFDVIFDNSFNHEQKVWFELRIVKELVHWCHTLGYANVIDWHEHTYMLEDSFTPKSEAEKFLFKAKKIEVSSIMLSHAKLIHPLYFSILNKNINSVLPPSILKKISFDQIDELVPTFEQIIETHSKSLLDKFNCQCWDEVKVIKSLS